MNNDQEKESSATLKEKLEGYIDDYLSHKKSSIAKDLTKDLTGYHSAFEDKPFDPTSINSYEVSMPLSLITPALDYLQAQGLNPDNYHVAVNCDLEVVSIFNNDYDQFIAMLPY